MGAFVGPSPATGYHFISNIGVLSNDTTKNNLIRSLERVQNVSYSVGTNFNTIDTIGHQGHLDYQSVQYPDITLNIDYLPASILNELRLGFYCNYNTSGDIPYYTNNSGVCLISGFVSRSNKGIFNDIRWPLEMRDERNIFIPIRFIQDDLLVNRTTGYQNIDQNSSQIGAYCFGNCYLTNYRVQGSVGNVMSASTTFKCGNLKFTNASSGDTIPAISYNSGESTNIFAIPQLDYNSTPLPALKSEDILISLRSRPRTDLDLIGGTGNISGTHSNIRNTMVDFQNIPLQSFGLSIDLSRKNIASLGDYTFRDRIVNFPVAVDFNITSIVQSGYSGSILNLLDKNNDYDATIRVKHITGQQTIVQYDLLSAKLVTSNYGVDINGQLQATYSFTTDIDPDNYNKGLFISGAINPILQVNNSKSIIPLLNIGINYLLYTSGSNTGYLVQGSPTGKLKISNYTFYV